MLLRLLFAALMLINTMSDYYSSKKQDAIHVKMVVPGIIHPYEDIPIVIEVTNKGEKPVKFLNPSYLYNSFPKLYHNGEYIDYGIRVKHNPKLQKIIETILPGEIKSYRFSYSFNELYYTRNFKDGFYSFYIILELKGGADIISDTTFFTFSSD